MLGMRIRGITLAVGIVCVMTASVRVQAAPPPLRPPAAPLVAHDPYFSVWSFGDKLNADWPRHWTGAVNGMCAIVRVDGKPYVLMGNPKVPGLELATMPQRSIEVLPTRTIYMFAGA